MAKAKAARPTVVPLPGELHWEAEQRVRDEESLAEEILRLKTAGKNRVLRYLSEKKSGRGGRFFIRDDAGGAVGKVWRLPHRSAKTPIDQETVQGLFDNGSLDLIDSHDGVETFAYTGRLLP